MLGGDNPQELYLLAGYFIAHTVNEPNVAMGIVLACMVGIGHKPENGLYALPGIMLAYVRSRRTRANGRHIVFSIANLLWFVALVLVAPPHIVPAASILFEGMIFSGMTIGLFMSLIINRNVAVHAQNREVLWQQSARYLLKDTAVFLLITTGRAIAPYLQAERAMQLFYTIAAALVIGLADYKQSPSSEKALLSLVGAAPVVAEPVPVPAVTTATTGASGGKLKAT